MNSILSKRKRAKYVRKSFGEHLFDVFNVLLFAALTFSFIYPFINILVVSLNDPYDAMRGGIYFWPRQLSFDNYKKVLADPLIYNAYAVTVARTLVGTATHLFVTGIFAYGMSRKQLMFKKYYTIFCTIPMFFSGGLIPTYILYRTLGITNSFWVYIIPSIVSVWNMLILRSFYQGIPDSLEEAARIDGCGDYRIFFQIIAPISVSSFAAIALFKGVEHWNAWFDAYIYINNDKLIPLQTILMRIIDQSAASQLANLQDNVELATQQSRSSGENVTPESIRYATMIVSIGPIVLIYPFLQKYFVKGVLIGSVKE